MAEQIVELDTGIGVRTKAGGLQPIPAPSGISSHAFRSIVAAVDTYHRLEGTVPTPADLVERWPRLHEQTISRVFASLEFTEAMAYRGIELGKHAGFTLEQQAALIMLSNPTDRRRLNTKLAELGVPFSRYQSWLKQPHFAAAVNRASETVLQEAVAPTLVALAGKAMDGDDTATKLLLEMTGRWNPNQASLDEARTVVRVLLESVVRHVGDNDIKRQILEDVTLASATMKALEA